MAPDVTGQLDLFAGLPRWQIRCVDGQLHSKHWTSEADAAVVAKVYDREGPAVYPPGYCGGGPHYVEPEPVEEPEPFQVEEGR